MVRIAFTLFFIVALIFVGLKIVPVYFGNYSFKDFVEDESRRASYSPASTEETVRDEVFKKAQEYEIPLTKEQIKVSKGSGGGLQAVVISADYDVHVDLMVTSTDLHFSVASQNKPM
jgi:hypothetical protein